MDSQKKWTDTLDKWTEQDNSNVGNDEASGIIKLRLRASQGAPEMATAFKSKEDSTLEKVQELVSMAANVIAAIAPSRTRSLVSKKSW